VGGTRGPRLDGVVDQQEHDRPGRVPADRRDRTALRAHDGRPVERARGGQHHRHLGHRLVGGLHAGGDGGQVAVAGQAAGRGQASRQPELRVRPGSGGMAQVRPLLGRRNTRGADGARPVHDGPGLDAGAGGREHDHGRADPRRHLHRRVRAGRGNGEGAGPAAGRQGLDIDIHVDGASGGFLAPFCAPDVAFDFRLPRVKSISASGHKFGLAPLGVGWVVWRDAAELPDDLVFHVNYLGGDMPVFQINFSRPAGQITASYYNFLRLGREGYRRIHQASYDIGQYLATEIVKLGPFELLCDSNPNTGIPTVTWRIRDGEDPGYTLFDLADRLRNKGWQVPAYTLTRAAADIAVQRILVRLGVSQDMASLLLDDFRDAVAHFSKHPVTVSMTKQESGGFSHL